MNTTSPSAQNPGTGETRRSHYIGTQPDAGGHFGPYGGRYIGETLAAPIDELKAAWEDARRDPAFKAEFHAMLRDYAGRPSPLDFCARLTAFAGGAKIFLKREDCNHTGAHKVNNVVGQGLLARRMGKGKLIAETGAGQHGVATATIAARFGMRCTVFMGAEDVRRQAPNVLRMKMLGAEVVPVSSGTATLKDAMNEAMRHWVAHATDTYYVIGTAAGPDPYPEMVRDFQRVIGDEARAQILERTGRLPDLVVACVGGGSNAIGAFYPFLDDPGVALLGAEAGGEGVATGRHAASIGGRQRGILHGAKTYLLQNEDGQVHEAWSISAGLDYPGVGPEHALLADLGRARYVPVTDEQAVRAFNLLCRLEGIIPALESSHAVAAALDAAKAMRPDERIVVCLSGRGDKDIDHVTRWMAGHGVTAEDCLQAR